MKYTGTYDRLRSATKSEPLGLVYSGLRCFHIDLVQGRLGQDVLSSAQRFIDNLLGAS